MKKLFINMTLLAMIGLAGCSSNPSDENTGIGAASGAVLGGLGAIAFRGHAVAIGASMVGGAIIGGLIGHSMDNTDHAASATAMKNNSTNQTTQWVNANTHTTYTMTPTSGFFTIDGNPNCRKFHFTSTCAAGKTKNSTGTACLTQDGAWRTI